METLHPQVSAPAEVEKADAPAMCLGLALSCGSCIPAILEGDKVTAATAS